MLPTKSILAENINRLLKTKPKLPRPDMARKMDIGDKSLGFLKSGTGNPTLESIEKVAAFLRVQPWELLVPQGTEASSSSRGAAGDNLPPRLSRLLELLKDMESTGNLTPAVYDLFEAALAVAAASTLKTTKAGALKGAAETLDFAPPPSTTSDSESSQADDYARLRDAINHDD